MTAKKNKNGLIIGLIITSIVALMVLVIFMQEKNYRWSETYDPLDDQPYGTIIFHTLMKAVRGDQTFVMVKDSAFKELPKNPTIEVDNYIYIGSEFYANLDDTKQIFEFVAEGNNAYIFCANPNNLVADSVLKIKEIIPDSFIAEIQNEDDYYYTEPSDSELLSEDEVMVEEEIATDDEWDSEQNNHNEMEVDVVRKYYSIVDSIIVLSLLEKAESTLPNYPLQKFNHFEKTSNDWAFFNDSLVTINGENVKQIGFFDEEYPNYIKCPYGKGQFYFHSTPLVFTNYYMLSDTAMRYCREALASMGKGIVYWDEDNRDYDAYNYNFDYNSQDPNKPREGPMEFILSEPNLKYAWYTLLAAGFLYLLFGARRKQRIIPAVDNMENTSIEYTEVISQMFMNQSDHKKLVAMKMDLFRSYLRDRFNIKLPVSMSEENDNLYKEISNKCNVKCELITNIFEQNKFLTSIVVVETDEMLIFHKRLEEFYENSK